MTQPDERTSRDMQITTEGPYARLCTFLETMLTQIWCAQCPRPSGQLPLLHRASVNAEHSVVVSIDCTCAATEPEMRKDACASSFCMYQ